MQNLNPLVMCVAGGARAVPGGARHAGALSFAGPKPSSHVHGRWARERYQAARDTLVACLKRLRPASGPPHVLRSALREEARRTIGAPRAHGFPALSAYHSCFFIPGSALAGHHMHAAIQVICRALLHLKGIRLQKVLLVVHSFVLQQSVAWGGSQLCVCRFSWTTWLASCMC